MTTDTTTDAPEQAGQAAQGGAPRQVTLDDKYTLEAGVVFMTGIQALVRLPLEQRRRDRAAGLRTGGYISGYQGSPLAAIDGALRRAQAQGRVDVGGEVAHGHGSGGQHGRHLTGNLK